MKKTCEARLLGKLKQWPPDSRHNGEDWARQCPFRGHNRTLALQGDKLNKVLWIVCQVDALIAKVTANLENTVEATNDKPGLYGDNRIEFWGRDPASSFLCLKFPKSHS